MNAKYKLAILAILIIGSLETFALSQGIDGTMFAVAVGGIGAIVGYAFGIAKK